MRLILLTFFLFSFFVSVAQEKKFVNRTSIEAGLLEGEQGSALQLQIKNAMQFKNWLLGVGTGLDYYGVRSVPVFAFGQMGLFNKTQTPYLYLGVGYHFPWDKNDFNSEWYNVNFDGGLYYNGGIGYQLPAMKKAALFFNLGYSFKRHREEITEQMFCINPPCEERKQIFDYKLRRLSLTTGLRF